jgi:hypothetical protein
MAAKRGARLDLKDVLWRATPLVWAGMKVRRTFLHVKRQMLPGLAANQVRSSSLFDSE